MGSWWPNISSCGQRRLIRLGECPVWSESLLGAQIIFVFMLRLIDVIYCADYYSSPKRCQNYITEYKFILCVSLSVSLCVVSRNFSSNIVVHNVFFFLFFFLIQSWHKRNQMLRVASTISVHGRPCSLTLLRPAVMTRTGIIKLSRLMTKPAKWLCAQRRLRSAWASAQSDLSLRFSHEESLGACRTAKTLIRLGGCPGCAPSEDSDQPGHLPSLIWVFAFRMKKAWVLSAQRRLWSDWADAQADPSFLHAKSEDSDQTGQMPRLIWVFAGRTVILLVLSWGGSIVIFARYVHLWYNQTNL